MLHFRYSLVIEKNNKGIKHMLVNIVAFYAYLIMHFKIEDFNRMEGSLVIYSIYSEAFV